MVTVLRFAVMLAMSTKVSIVGSTDKSKTVMVRGGSCSDTAIASRVAITNLGQQVAENEHNICTVASTPYKTGGEPAEGKGEKVTH